MNQQRWECPQCSHIFHEEDFLKAPNPWKKDDTILGCPNCFGVGENFGLMCDVPGCEMEASCGWPGPNGYRRTCYDHWEKCLPKEPPSV